MKTTELGKFGETYAAEYLRNNGYRIIETNFRCRSGEIDLIASDEAFIVFAEVKLRKNACFAEAKEYVTYAKQSRIKSAAMYYLSGKNTELQPRFDVIEIYAPDGSEGNITLNHLENAFY